MVLVAVVLLMLVPLGMLGKSVFWKYLQTHHDTMLATCITLLLPPPDLYSAILSQDVDVGHDIEVSIKHRYSGSYFVLLRGPEPDSALEGHLDCVGFVSSLKPRGPILDARGAATILGEYFVDGSLVDRILRCQLYVSASSSDGPRTIEIARASVI